jgi:hypothetical protein
METDSKVTIGDQMEKIKSRLIAREEQVDITNTMTEGRVREIETTETGEMVVVEDMMIETVIETEEERMTTTEGETHQTQGIPALPTTEVGTEDRRRTEIGEGLTTVLQATDQDQEVIDERRL